LTHRLPGEKASGLFYAKIKKEVMQMAKTIDQLQAEIEKKEAQLSQERHKEQRDFEEEIRRANDLNGQLSLLKRAPPASAIWAAPWRALPRR